jgi:hypothetical protein
MTYRPAGTDRLRDAFLRDTDIAGDGRDCPSAERIRRSATGGASRDEDRLLIAHLAECGVCAANWRIAREMLGAEEDVAAPPAPALRRYGPALALAASLTLAVGLGFLIAPDALRDEAVYRVAGADWLEPLPGDGATLPRDAFDLRWGAGPLGSTYDVRATTEQLDLVAEGLRLDRPRFHVPAEALDPLPDGARVAWQVTAHLPDGGRVESESFFSVIGPAESP